MSTIVDVRRLKVNDHYHGALSVPNQSYIHIKTLGKMTSLCRIFQNDFRGHTKYTPDATPCDFFLWGYVKDQDQVHVPLLPASIPELKV